MKKSFSVLIILLLVSLGLVVVGGASLAYSGSQVTVEELNSFGDKSAAEGIRLQIPVGCLDARLNWNTEYKVGDESAIASVINYYQKAQADKWRLREEDAARLDITTNYGSFYQGGTLNYKYYYTLSVSGTVILKNEPTAYLYRPTVWPSKGNEYIEIKCFDVYSVGTTEEASEYPEKNLCRGIGYRASEPNNVSAYSVSEATDTDLYYAVDLRLKDGGRPAADIFESGYGVWRIGYQVREEKETVSLEFTEKTQEFICEIDPEEMLLEIAVSEDENDLYVITARNGMCYLSVIDLEGTRPEQKLELMTYDEESTPKIYHVFLGENVVAPRLVGGKMAVVAANESGMYEFQFVMDKAKNDAEPTTAYLVENYGKNITHWDRAPVSVEMACKDGKLAMVYSLTNSYGNFGGDRKNYRIGCFWLAIYDETGLVYAGEYGMSQGIGEVMSGRERTDMCEIQDNIEIGISWGE